MREFYRWAYYLFWAVSVILFICSISEVGYVPVLISMMGLMLSNLLPEESNKSKQGGKNK